jgi:hypothetical protein
MLAELMVAWSVESRLLMVASKLLMAEPLMAGLLMAVL